MTAPLRPQVPKAWVLSAVVTLVDAPASDSCAQPPAPEAAAKQWLTYLDGGDYAKGWDRAGGPFKARNTAAVLKDRIGPLRERLGAILERRLFRVTLSNTAPGLPDGTYASVQFQSRFADKSETGETVWLDREADRWAVIGYFLGGDSQPAAWPARAGENCTHAQQVQARIARMNGYSGGPHCNLPE